MPRTVPDPSLSAAGSTGARPRADPGTGGRRALAGFLYQILRSVRLGLELTATFASSRDGPAGMVLTLEPEGAGDLRLDVAGGTVVEEVKIRTGGRPWSTGEIARRVLPSLLRDATAADRRRFRFVSNNGRGLEALRDYLDWRGRDGADDARFALGRREVGPGEFLASLAASAGVPVDDDRLARVLDGLEIVATPQADVERGVDRLLAPMLGPGEDPPTKRHELVGRILEAARDGAALRGADLLRMIGPDAGRRLAHAASIPDLSLAAARHDAGVLGYDPAMEARANALTPDAPFTVFSGESGQGKTWSLCRSALSLAREGGAVVLVGSPIAFAQVEKAVADRLWAPAFGREAPLVTIADRLRADLGRASAFWLTLFVDDVQDRVLARQLAATDWEGLGVRLVVACQPRIARELVVRRPDAVLLAAEDFTSAEMRRHLRLHGRNDALEAMPDDVFELLQKPVHARVFVELPPTRGWSDSTEYELFAAYWREATGEYREQEDHPFDRHRLVDLADTLLDVGPAYPWPGSAVAPHLDEAAVVRLEAVGLLRRVGSGVFAFSTDRMLNWAVAEAIAARAVRLGLAAAGVDALVEGLDGIVARDRSPLGRRLGYVFHDLVWLLLDRGEVALVTELVAAHVLRQRQEWRGERHWRGLGTVGPRLLPVLQLLALRDYDAETAWDIPMHLPDAIVAAGRSAPAALEGIVAALLADGRPKVADVGLKVARKVALPGVLDSIDRTAAERSRALEERGTEDGSGRSGDVIGRYSLGIDALKRAVSAAPDWLDARLAAETDDVVLDQLLWCLQNDDCLLDRESRAIWDRRQGRLVAIMPVDSKALVGALGRFGAAGDRDRLDRVPRTTDDWMDARVLKSLSRVDPEAALAEIASSEGGGIWHASNWWLPGLARHDPVRLSRAIRRAVAGRPDPAAELVHIYAFSPELMDDGTLEIVLDGFAESLVADCNAAAEGDGTRPHYGMLRFLCGLVEPRQFDALRRRAGTALEAGLLRLATTRRGRTTRVTDAEGRFCERLLAMVSEEGFASLSAHEIGRPDPFGREDGYLSAQWTEARSVKDALAGAPEEERDDGYRAVVRMQALAIHACDAALESMVRAGSPVYLKPAEMRSSGGRPLEALKARMELLAASGMPEDVEVAADLGAFLLEPGDVRALLPPLLDDAMPEGVRRSILATFKALDFYDPAVVPVARSLLASGTEDQAWLIVRYMAEAGDAEGRSVAVAWLDAVRGERLGSSVYETLGHVLDRPEIRTAVGRLFLRARDAGVGPYRGDSLRLLADEGDGEARRALVGAAFRSPEGFRTEPGAGIRLLLRDDPEEAFFATVRLFTRHPSAEAAGLLLDVDRDRGASLLLDAFAAARPSVRAGIGRHLRLRLGSSRLSDRLDGMVLAGAEGRRAAAELAGWMPPGVDLPWLDGLADDREERVREAAAVSLRRRRLEAAGMGHLAAMSRSSKPLRWARLQTVIETVDPAFLWSRDDPASLGPFLEDAPTEFWEEAAQRRERRAKELDDEERKADRNAA